MKKAVLILFFISTILMSQGTVEWRYFNKLSAVYSGSSLASFYTGQQIGPRQMAYILKFQQNETRSLEQLWKEVFNYINLQKKINVLTLDVKNKPAVVKEIKKYLLKNKLTVVLYKKGKKTHSALIAGYRVDADNNISAFRMNDSGAQGQDIIDVKTMKSQYWGAEVYKAYIVR